MSGVKSGGASGVSTRSTNKAIRGGEVIETDQRGDTSGTCQGSTVLHWVRTNRCGTARRRHGRGKSRKCRKKRKLTEAAEQLVAAGGHHLVDAEGLAGLELRPVDEGFIDEVVGAGSVNEEEYDESD